MHIERRGLIRWATDDTRGTAWDRAGGRDYRGAPHPNRRGVPCRFTLLHITRVNAVKPPAILG